jgi:putative oxidoreductase
MNVCPQLAYSFTKGGVVISTYFYPITVIRYLVSFVFITSGVMKLIGTELAHLFISLGLPYPHLMLYVVALLEIICGLLILANKSVKYAAIPLIGIIIAALFLTKLPSLNSGLLQFAFNARLDIVMLGLLFVLYSSSPH